MSTYPVLILQYAKQPKQQMTVITTGMATNKVLATLKELAEFLAGLRWDGLIVVVVRQLCVPGHYSVAPICCAR